MVSISIGISTVQANFSEAECLAKDISNLGSQCICEVFLLSQREEEELECNTSKGIMLFKTQDSGLSKSRNFLIDKLSGDYLWLLDDDVILSEKSISEVINEIERFEYPDVLIGRIACSDRGDGRLYKNYHKRQGIKGLLSTSSIEMLLKKEFLMKKDIRFNEKFGLGAEYPCGEENDLLISCYNQGASICFSEKNFIYHPCNEKHNAPYQYFREPRHLIPKLSLVQKLPFPIDTLYFLKVVTILVLFVRSPRLASFFIKSLVKNLFK